MILLCFQNSGYEESAVVWLLASKAWCLLTASYKTPIISIGLNNHHCFFRNWARTWKRVSVSVRRLWPGWTQHEECYHVWNWRSWSSRTSCWRKTGTCWWLRWTRPSKACAEVFDDDNKRHSPWPFTVVSVCCELSPTCKLMWQPCNAWIMYNIG